MTPGEHASRTRRAVTACFATSSPRPPRKVTAGLVALPLSDPMATASGTRNLVTFHSRRYRREPLVISGPGAGPDVTAAGILNDICSLGPR